MRQFVVLVVLFALAGNAQALLIDRGGGLIYDTNLDVTWLQDANYAKTSGFDSDGKMTWTEGLDWADQLVFQGHDDWRLPQTLPVGAAYDYTVSFDGSTDQAYNITSLNSEMAHMYHVELGNLGLFDTSGVEPQPGWGLLNTDPFMNLQEGNYWSGSDAPGAPATPDSQAWKFQMNTGGQDTSAKANPDYVWAVHDGDIGAQPIPEPSAALLFGIGFGVVSIATRRRRLN